MFPTAATPNVPVAVTAPSSMPFLSASATLAPLALMTPKSLLVPVNAMLPVVDARVVSPVAAITLVGV